MTVSSTTNKVSYSGNGTTTVFAYTFKIFADGDLDVYIRSSTGTETLKTLTTDYTVSNAGVDGGGNVTFVTAPASGETVVIQRKLDLTQGTDYVENDPFPAESHEEALDRLTFITQQMQEEIDRSIKASVTNTITSTEFTISAADRANKSFGFDSSGDLTVIQAIGTYKGDWAAGTSYIEKDLVKDTTTGNIFLSNTAHTSSGSLPITSNADSAKWDLLLDASAATTAAASATASAAAAATSESNAATSESNAATSESNASTSETNAATSETNASNAQSYAEEWANKAEDSLISVAAGGDGSTEYSAKHWSAKSSASASAAAATFDLFDDAYLGAKASDPTVDNDGDALADGALYFDTTNDVMKVYDLATTTWFQLTPTVSNQTKINTVADNISDVTTVADNLSSVSSFANIYRIDSADPTTSLDAGDLVFNTTDSVLKYYNGSAWSSISPGIANVVEDTTPQLGGTLDANGNSIDMGTYTITDAKVGQWDTAYGWGDHSAAGYVTETSSTGSAEIPTGTTAQRDVSPAAGMFRFNTTDSSFEGYDGSAWGAVGGGNTAVVGWENQITVAENYTITSGNNMVSAGPITIDTGFTVTVPTGSRWVVV